MSASAHPARARVRLLAATLVALAALTLTACEDGEGLRDEGPSTPSSPTATVTDTKPSDTGTPSGPTDGPASARPRSPSR